MSKEKHYLILEKSSEPLDISNRNSDGFYIMEGVFAEFGIKNNNNRIYEEKEYLPHLEYLKEKIENHNLVGEMNHPSIFDIDLKNVSHRVLDIRHDRKKRQLIGKIQILNTPSGKIAQQLLEGGVRLSISSRAAGSVGSNNKVQIKKIFAFDLVSDAGFKAATLDIINEGVQYMDRASDETAQFYEITDNEIWENLMYDNIIKKSNSMYENNISNIDVLNSAFENYSNFLSEKIQNINNRLSNVENRTDDLVDYTERIGDTVNKGFHFTNYLSEKLNLSINHAKHLTDKLNEAINYCEMIGENTENNIAYSKYLSENLDMAIEYENRLGHIINENIKWQEENNSINSAHIEYSELHAQKIDEMENAISEASELYENLVSYTNKLGIDLNTSINYTESLAGVNKFNHAKNSVNSPKELNESNYNHQLYEVNDYDNLGEKINKILESAENESAERYAVNSKYPFLEYLNSRDRKRFLHLSESDKQKVSGAIFSHNGNMNEENEILEVWESALTEAEYVRNKWFTEMPSKYHEVWENLSESQKEVIIKRAQLYALNTPYQINNFWSTLQLPKINKNMGIYEDDNISSLGYSKKAVDMVAESLRNFNR